MYNRVEGGGSCWFGLLRQTRNKTKMYGQKIIAVVFVAVVVCCIRSLCVCMFVCACLHVCVCVTTLDFARYHRSSDGGVRSDDASAVPLLVDGCSTSSFCCCSSASSVSAVSGASSSWPAASAIKRTSRSLSTRSCPTIWTIWACTGRAE